ncbi:MAG: DUF1294 domain-containing protein [Oscillospiraceae bacterium]|nr:DUF1294 domain-containing protein [Oscillospiraceae bacterium]
MFKYRRIYLAALSLVLFIMMGHDKRRARRGGRRVPEKRLFALATLGGALGGWLGMYAFHHKTRHWYFKFGFPALALLQAAALVFMYVKIF